MLHNSEVSSEVREREVPSSCLSDLCDRCDVLLDFEPPGLSRTFPVSRRPPQLYTQVVPGGEILSSFALYEIP